MKIPSGKLEVQAKMVWDVDTQKRWALKVVDQLKDMGCDPTEMLQMLSPAEAALGLSMTNKKNIPGYFENLLDAMAGDAGNQNNEAQNQENEALADDEAQDYISPSDNHEPRAPPENDEGPMAPPPRKSPRLQLMGPRPQLRKPQHMGIQLMVTRSPTLIISHVPMIRFK